MTDERRVPIPAPAARYIDSRRDARLERVLAVGRAFLTVSALTAIYLDPTEPARLAAETYGVLLAYAVYSLLVLAYVQRARRVGVRLSRILHGFDMLWASALTFVSEGPVSPFFLFFLFVVLAAAYRWGLVGTIATSVITVTVFLIETVVAALGPWNATWFASIDFSLNTTILRVAYLLLTGFLLGYLAEQEKHARAELAVIAEMVRQPRVHLGLGRSVTMIAHGLLRTFGAAEVAFVVQDHHRRRTFLWRVEATTPTTYAPPRTELAPPEREAWLFADPGRTWHAIRRDTGDTLRAHVVDPDAWPLRRCTLGLPSVVETARPCSRLAVANLGMPGAWRGRVYLFDPVIGRAGERQVHFLDALVEHVTPALTNVFLLNRLRARVTAAERARVARELHDGAIQSLFGLEMKIEAVRRGPTPLPPDADRELGHVQTLLEGEVLALRELMQALRPVEFDAGDQLPDVLAGVVERFRRDTGVSARFVFGGGSVLLPPATAIEAVRIVQEALVNVRKHSRARNVLVRLTGRDGGCDLVIEDDGVGFGFEGALSGDELDRRRLGPTIIKERARVAGARVLIESTPGAGARLELSFEGSHV